MVLRLIESSDDTATHFYLEDAATGGQLGSAAAIYSKGQYMVQFVILDEKMEMRIIGRSPPAIRSAKDAADTPAILIMEGPRRVGSILFCYEGIYSLLGLGGYAYQEIQFHCHQYQSYDCWINGRAVNCIYQKEHLVLLSEPEEEQEKSFLIYALSETDWIPAFLHLVWFRLMNVVESKKRTSKHSKAINKKYNPEFTAEVLVKEAKRLKGIGYADFEE